MPVAYLPGHEPKDDNHGTPPTDPPDDMEARVAKLEASVSHIERDMAAMRTDVAVMRVEMKNFATKEDLAKLEVKTVEGTNKVIMWVVSAVFLAQLLPVLLKRFGV